MIITVVRIPIEPPVELKVSEDFFVAQLIYVFRFTHLPTSL